MSEQREWVQCFYNAHFNHLYPEGKRLFVYGFMWVKLGGDGEHVSEQIKKSLKDFEYGDIYNFQLNTLTPFPDNVFSTNPNL